MRPAAIALLLVSLAVPLLAQDNSGLPTNEKAQKRTSKRSTISMNGTQI
jgi:hypothetical protein